MSTVVWGNETMDVSGELLAQALDGDFTKDTHESPTKNAMTALIRDPESSVIFYGIVKVPDWFKFDENRMFCDPAKSRKLLKRGEVLTALSKKGFECVKYHPINKDISYSSLRNKLGAKFDIVSKAGMKVVGTVKNSKDLNNARNKAQFACKHMTKITKKYRVYFGQPNIQAIIGASASEYRTLSFREAVMFESTEEARAHMESLFEEGILNDAMGTGFKAWTEEAFLTNENFVQDTNTIMFETLSKAINELYDIDLCAVDIVVDDNQPIITNITACPSLQTDSVLGMISNYFNTLLEEGRKITPDHIKKLVEGMSTEQLDVVAKLFKKALVSGV